jgi:hypothetical protein
VLRVERQRLGEMLGGFLGTTQRQQRDAEIAVHFECAGPAGERAFQQQHGIIEFSLLCENDAQPLQRAAMLAIRVEMSPVQALGLAQISPRVTLDGAHKIIVRHQLPVCDVIAACRTPGGALFHHAAIFGMPGNSTDIPYGATIRMTIGRRRHDVARRRFRQAVLS